MTGFSTNKKLRLERDVIYEDLGGLHAFKMDVFERTGNTAGAISTHILMDQASSMKVATEFDLNIIKALIKSKNE